ncbi:MAG: hypothetical protein ACYS18_10295 [Planctomycetota bacterium]
MKKQEKLNKLLKQLANTTEEPVRPSLADDIKNRIPRRLIPQGGLGNINIIIDLRINKLAAAAVIIITMVICANFFARKHTPANGIYKEGKMLVKYLIGAADEEKDKVVSGKAEYEKLLSRGKEVYFYGETTDLQDSNSVLIQWKLEDGNYRVIFADLRARTVTPEQLIRLQAKMLQGNNK